MKENEKLISKLSSPSLIEEKKNKKSWKFRSLQFLQLISLFISYGSIYLFLVVLSISTPLMINSKFITIQEISIIIILTKVTRCISKFISGSIVDNFGGKQIFLISHFLIASIIIISSIKPSKILFSLIF